MRQTQTKFYAFSDYGLDIAVSNKALFPSVIKKIVNQGYNTQTVTSVSVEGNQVTLTYNLAHNYVVNRVLQLNAPELLTINGGQFCIDSVTALTVTLTIDNPPTSISGGFTTFVAPLGWSIVYEKDNIVIYEFKHLDETPCYLRICYEPDTTSVIRHAIVPCVGNSYDPVTGYIVDPDVPQENTNCSLPSETSPNNYRWALSVANTISHNNYTYSQGYPYYGKTCVVGSPYHFTLNYHVSSTLSSSGLLVILPFNSHLPDGYLPKLPILSVISDSNPLTSSISGSSFMSNFKFLLGTKQLSFDFPGSTSTNSFLYSYSSNIVFDSISYTFALPVYAFSYNEGQPLGSVSGLYRLFLKPSEDLPVDLANNYFETVESDYSNLAIRYAVHMSASSSVWLLSPIEEIKLVN